MRRVPRLLIGLIAGISAVLKLLSPAEAVRAVSLSPSDLLALHATAILAAFLLLEIGVAWASLRLPRSFAGRAVPLAFVLLLVAARALHLLPVCSCFGPLSGHVPRDAVLGALLVCAALDWALLPELRRPGRAARAETAVLAATLAGAVVVGAAAAGVGDAAPGLVVVRDVRATLDPASRTLRVRGQVANVSTATVHDVRLVPTCPACVESAVGADLPELAPGAVAGFEIVERLDVDRGGSRPGLHVWYSADRGGQRVWVPYPGE